MFAGSTDVSASIVIKPNTTPAGPVPTAGLVGYWKFDEGTGTSATDSSGNGNTGTLANGGAGINLPEWIDGKKIKGLHFQGTASYVGIPDSNSLDISDNLSMSFWIRLTANPSSSSTFVFSKFDGSDTSNANFVMYVSSSRSLVFVGTAGGTWQEISASSTLQLNRWYHIGLVYNSTSGGQLYVDGKPTGYIYGSGTLATNSSPIDIGHHRAHAAQDSFYGDFDEVRIYNQALTSEQIKALYLIDNRSVKTNISNTNLKVSNRDYTVNQGVNVDFDFENSTTNSCPVGWVCSGDAITGSSGTTCGPGGINGSKYFRLGCDDTVGYATSSSFVLPTGISKITFLRAGGADTGGFFLKKVSDNSVLCSSSNGTDSDTFFADECTGLSGYAGESVYITVFDDIIGGWGKVSVDNILFKDASNNTLSLVSTISALKVHYTFDGKKIVSNTLKDSSIYNVNATKYPEVGGGGGGYTIDGADTLDWEGNPTSYDGAYNLYSTFGGKSAYKKDDDSGYLYYCPMEMYGNYEWRISSMAPSDPCEFAYGEFIAYSGSPIDAPEDGSWFDYMYFSPVTINFTPIAAAGALVHHPTVSGKSGQAIDFGGVDDYATFADTSLPLGDDARTFCAWVKPESVTGTSVIFAYGTDTSGNAFKVLRDGTSAVVSGNGSSVTETNFFSNNTWKYICASYDGTNAKIFGNGAEVESGAMTWDTTLSGTAYIGVDIGAASNFWNGVVDDVRVYNYALSITDISSLYSKTGGNKLAIKSTVSNKNTSGLIGHWTFDGLDISGTTVLDKSGFGRDGTITGAKIPYPGKLGQALKVGSDNYVEVANEENFLYIDSFTISTWVKNITNTNNARIAIVSDNSNHKAFDMYRTSGGNLVFNIYNDGGEGVANSCSSCVTETNSWYHVVGVFDGSNTKIYVNGVLKNTNTNASIDLANVTSSSLFFGCESGGSSCINGVVDDMRLYNRALSQTEIVELYNLKR